MQKFFFSKLISENHTTCFITSLEANVKGMGPKFIINIISLEANVKGMGPIFIINIIRAFSQ